MDPISLIVAAVAAGAAAGLKDTAASAVKDAYAALKGLLSKRGVDVGAVERKPESEPKRDSLAEDLKDGAAGDDVAVLEAAQRVIDEVRANDAAAAKAVGVDLDEVHAAFIRIADIKARGNATAVDLDHVTTTGGIDISGVDVDSGASPERP
ncbi:hypothetical protein [Solirubrobacter soli]|uniref:hypothetical protein n=1 Tax=Solirubrobacter soli TaxID=363832 RepID=UPI00041D23A3|nr:hypothetical protein [Solirubrobacter soli]